MTLNGCELKKVDDFLYLGSWFETSNKDINTRITKAWSALSKMDTMWKYNLNSELKIGFFRATVETVLLYGCSTWTITVTLGRKLYGTSTRHLMSNGSLTQPTKSSMAIFPKSPSTIQQRRLKLFGD